MSVVVLGPNGLIGSALVAQGAIGIDADIVDIPDLTEGLLAVPDITAVINAAGYTNVDGCETDPVESYLVNVGGVHEVVETLKVVCDPLPLLVHLSTDFIFDGRDGPYSEEALPCPISVYGAQKYLAESIVRQYPRHLIVRTTCVFGKSKKKRTFVHWVVDQLKKGYAFDVTYLQRTSPTYNVDLARIILSLINAGAEDVYNVASFSHLSRYVFARQIAKAFGYNPELVEMAGALMQPARRPKLGGLITGKLQALGIAPQPLEESLKELATTWEK